MSARVSPYILSAPDPLNNEVQPRAVKTLRVPDYFAEYRDKGDGLAGFLGTSIIAKVSVMSCFPVGPPQYPFAHDDLNVAFVQRFGRKELCLESRLREQGSSCCSRNVSVIVVIYCCIAACFWIAKLSRSHSHTRPGSWLCVTSLMFAHHESWRMVMASS